MRRIPVSITLGVILLLSLAIPALAAKPTIERFPIDEQFEDTFLSEICGFEVMVSSRGHVVVHTWTDGEGNFVREVFTIAIRSTMSAGGQTLHFVDTGMDTTTALGDGSFMVTVHGNIRLITAPGQGPLVGAAGRLAFVLTPAFDEDGNPILDEEGNQVFDFELLSESGLQVDDPEALCAALEPPA